MKRSILVAPELPSPSGAPRRPPELTRFWASMYARDQAPAPCRHEQKARGNVRPILHRRRSREEELPARPRGPGVGRGPAPGDGANLRPLLDLRRPRLRARETRRFPLAQGGGTAGDLLPGPD